MRQRPATGPPGEGPIPPGTVLPRLAAMMGDPLGTHRVLHPRGALPQGAHKLDNDPLRRYETEIHVDVELLNVDAASFRQMADATGQNLPSLAELARRTIDERGKLHNPVTGSGGVLLGRVGWIGAAVRDRGFSVGDRVVTLASLTLTPLALTRIGRVWPRSAQIEAEGTAVVFASAPLARLPADLSESLSTALFDVAGAALQTSRLVAPSDLAVVLGAGGKAGLLCCAEAMRRVGPSGMVIGIEVDRHHADELDGLGLCSQVVRADACRPTELRDRVLRATEGRLVDCVISCVNVPGVEMAAALLTRPRGRICFFSMTTNFAAAALGAEGISKDIDMYIGNGFGKGHVEHTLELVRSSPGLRALLRERYDRAS